MKKSGRDGNLDLDSKVDGLVKHCQYMIAAGKWSVGSKLISIRKGETLWGLNRITIQRAYKKLESKGLIESRRKSGYYILDQEPVRRITRNRYELEQLFGDISTRIRDEYELSPLGVLRYLSNLAEIHYGELPDCAFVDSTKLHAQAHAEEIRQRLGVPVMAFDLDEIGRKRLRVPRHVRKLFTTYFHLADFQAVRIPDRLDVIALPIEISPEISEIARKGRGTVEFWEVEDSDGQRISRDIQVLLGKLHVKNRVVVDVEKALHDYSETENKGTILLPSGIWELIPARWRSVSWIKPLSFRISPTAWPMIADVIGMPLGEIRD